MYRILFCIATLFTVCTAPAQERTFLVSGIVTDRQNGEPLPAAAVKVAKKGKMATGTVSDANGRYAVRTAGHVRVELSYVGYQPLDTLLYIGADRQLDFALTPSATALNEVTVTAQEKKGMTSTSVIGRTAMEHLQPSSFTDLLALLPGGMTKVPNMGQANVIRLREVGISSSDYATSSLGTKFMIDGTTIGTDANLQYVPDATQNDADSRRNHIGFGVDMRNIPTDNIESVEIVRGIPSVKYGDLTSGLVRITRKSAFQPLEARFKADEYGKLLSVGKGVDLARNWSANVDGGLFSSRIDPRNPFETYNRMNLSVRTRKQWNLRGERQLTWNLNMDYQGNIDHVRTDPETQLHEEDSYKSYYHQMGASNTLKLTYPRTHWMKSLSLFHSASLSIDRIKQRKYMSLDHDYIMPLLYDEGEHDGMFLPYHYVAEYEVEGLPFYSNLRLEGESGFTTGPVKHTLSAGLEWQMNKNYGRGQIYDITRPLNAGTARRPRAFSEIPATHIVSAYAEEYATMKAGRHQLSLMAGVRLSQMQNLDSRFAMHGKVYADPRANIQWDLPRWGDWQLYVSAGIGRMSKMPTMSTLYQDKLYVDLTQLYYWHTNADYKRINLRSYSIDRNNYALEPAHNTKWEVRLGGSCRNHNFYITYFRENMADGFRDMTQVKAFQYRKYDTSGIDAKALTAPPALEELPWQNDTILSTYSLCQNGSRTMKEGIEFQYSSPRMKVINTRLTVNGAWFHTIYESSLPRFYAGIAQVIGTVAVNNKYIGYYDWRDQYNKHQLTTNIIVDTYLDRLGAILSATAECYWMGRNFNPAKSIRPIAYIDTREEMHPYTEESAQDTFLQWLSLNGTTASDMTSHERFYMLVNFKATKRFGRSLVLSFFADRLLSIAPDYEVNGFTIRRSFAPYFGMELNIKI